MKADDFQESRTVLLERACAALTVLVRREYPDFQSLAKMGFLSGEMSEEQMAALKWLENQDSPK